MSNKHTHGPWFSEDLIEGTDQEFIGVSSDNVNNIADVWAIDTTQEQCRANARLIAAAPELLDALETMVRYSQGGDIPPKSVVDRAHSAIAKAIGPARQFAGV